jgi:hypothetical protein
VKRVKKRVKRMPIVAVPWSEYERDGELRDMARNFVE